MFQITLDKENNAIVRGEFWELDHMYFNILKFAGKHGMHQTCPFPGYEKATDVLLALAYEIRQAEQWNRELYVYWNGIPEGTIAPLNTPHEQIIKPENVHDPDDVIKDVEDTVMMDSDTELDDFYEMDEDEQTELLEDLRVDEDEIDAYMEYLHQPQTYPFAGEDYPRASGYNTVLQFRIPLPEALLYSLILNELLKQKDRYFEYSYSLKDKNPNGLYDYEIDMLNRRFRSEVLALQDFCEQTFACIYSIVGFEAYQEFRKIIEAPLSERSFFKDLAESDVKRIENVTAKAQIYSAEELKRFIQQLSLHAMAN